MIMSYLVYIQAKLFISSLWVYRYTFIQKFLHPENKANRRFTTRSGKRFNKSVFDMRGTQRQPINMNGM